MATIAIFFGVFLLYKLIVDFIIPIYRVSSQVKAQFRNMQQGREQQDADPLQSKPQSQAAEPRGKSADYIDFEEIKD